VTVQIIPMPAAQATRVAAPLDDAGLGCLRTDRGNLPLAALDVKADISGLVYRVELTQEFVNTHATHLEATYIFPLPDRAAVTGMRMTAADRVIDAKLQERAAAREAYDLAIAAGQRASIAEEERPDVFTMRVGNIVPGETVTVTLTLAGPLSMADGSAMFRFPLVVAPRYIPGTPLGEASVGDGYAVDTDAVPDASRITPPVLLPGFPNPLRLSIDVGVDPAGLPLAEGGVRSSLHAVSQSDGRWRIQPGERADRDFVLMLAYGAPSTASVLALHADQEGEEGTFELTVLPPALAAPARPRDVVLVVDRSGSMSGWKMVSARRAAARIVDTLTDADRFAVLTFDNVVDRPDGLPAGLAEATDRNRFRAVRHLSAVEARGGTEMLAPLQSGRALLDDRERDRVLVLVTDGQVGNEDQVLRHIGDLSGIRVHTIGIDRAVNAGFLGRLATAGGGLFELVESEDKLDEAMAHIHRRIGAPLVTHLRIEPAGLSIVDGTVAPIRLPDVFPGVPVVIRGRYRGAGGGLRLHGVAGSASGSGSAQAWSSEVTGERYDNAAATAIWARAHVRDLEDAYASGVGYGGRGDEALEKRVVGASLRFGVLCRFTAYVAVDDRVVNEGGEGHRVTQPVEPVSGWDMLGTGAAPAAPAPQRMAKLASFGSRARPMAAMPSARPVASTPPPASGAPVGPVAAGSMPPAPPAPGGSPAFLESLDSARSVARPDEVRERVERRYRDAGVAGPGGAAGRGGAAGPVGAAVPSPAPEPVPAPLPAPVQPGRPAPLPVMAREQLDRLRAAANRPAEEIRDLLLKLAEWLDWAATQLAHRSADGAAKRAAATEFAARIRAAGEPAQVWELYARAQPLLEWLAGGPAPGVAAAPPPGGQPKPRRAFWKRG
jgi:Ca-activated chloride channel homolog